MFQRVSRCFSYETGRSLLLLLQVSSERQSDFLRLAGLVDASGDRCKFPIFRRDLPSHFYPEFPEKM